METRAIESTEAIQKYELTPARVAAMVKEYHGLKVIEGDTTSYKQVRAACTQLVHIRTSVDKRRKELGEEAREYVKAVNSAAKQLLEPLAPLEERFKDELKAEDDRKAKIKEEKERKEKKRIDDIRSKIDAIRLKIIDTEGKTSDQILDMQLELEEVIITEDEYQEFTDEAQTILKETQEAIERTYKNRVQWEKDEAERKAEDERLTKERAEQEAKEKALEEERKKIEEEKAKIEQEKHDAQVREEAKAQAEKEAKEKAEKDIQERKDREEEERKEKERQETLKPDKEKLIALADRVAELYHPSNLPDLKDKKAIEILANFTKNLIQLAKNVRRNAEEL